ncbi:hypothetical protein ACFQY5_38315 [Paeniroseomonas aquatica]|uniref:DUF4426 domain-containing protein n=1 Tax=Paeniroseomonas aquatica TaxID=373043 RepID=A0ABT8A2Y6_9PROT|nr:hypothetical protein [Paeniroseomonas aquatica]MDN3563878.1 hypothetical protein [Paeniroseomonas aquatica]
MDDHVNRPESVPGSTWGSAGHRMSRAHIRAAVVPAMRWVGGGRRTLLAALPALVFAAAPRRAAALDPDGAFRQAGGLAIYLVVVPAAVVRGHPPEHTGRGAHGGVPEGRYVHHLLVALFDARTGTRVTDAGVTAVVHGLRHTPEDSIALEPMTVAGANAFGGFATLPARDYFRIEIEVLQPGRTAVHVVFPHRHFQP